MNLTLKQRGSFTSDGTAQKINLPGGADYFRVMNMTQLATTQATGRGFMFEWFPSMAVDNAIEWNKTNSTDATNIVLVTSGGFTYVESEPLPGTAFTITGITNATPAVVTTSAPHGYSNGDRVRIYGTTGALQYSSMDFTISSVGATTFTLLGLNTPGSAATGGSVRKIAPLAAVEPEALFVTAITQATSAVVTLSVAHNYQVGQLIYFSVPPDFGMTQINGLTGKITAIGTYTITVDINSSGFTAFAFPTSASSPVAFAMAGPGGQRNKYNVTEVPFHTGQFYPYMLLAAGAQSPAGSTSDVIEWFAFNGVQGIA